jgi:hypothetical protein
MIQDIIALSIVGLAAVYLGRVCWQSLMAKRSGCGSCGGCASDQQPLVQIQMVKK